MELVDLYDENRIPLGKTAGRYSRKGIGEYRTVVHICICNHKGQLLIQRRSMQKAACPGLWDVSAAGAVDAGETSRQGAERECREELGITVSVGNVYMELVHEYPDLTVKPILFHARIAEGCPQKLEHNDIRWLTVAEIDNYTFCPADKDILAKMKEDFL